MLACTHTHILDILLYSTYMTLYVQWKQSVCMHITVLYIHPFRIPPRPLYIPTPQRKVRERIQSMSIPSNMSKASEIINYQVTHTLPPPTLLRVKYQTREERDSTAAAHTLSMYLYSIFINFKCRCHSAVATTAK